MIREKPGGKVLAILPNGTTVIIVPNDIQEVNGVIWVHVIATVNDVRIEMPQSQSRVLDHLNRGEAFLTLRDGQRHHLIRKQRITRVFETPGP